MTTHYTTEQLIADGITTVADVRYFERESFERYLKAQNEEADAWMAAAPGRWRGKVPIEVEYWYNQGINCIGDFEAMMEAEFQREVRKNQWELLAEAYERQEKEDRLEKKNRVRNFMQKQSDEMYMDRNNVIADAFIAAIKKKSNISKENGS